MAMNRVVDITGDGEINGDDIFEIAKHWLQDEQTTDIYPRPYGDGIVDIYDLAILARYWQRPPG